MRHTEVGAPPAAEAQQREDGAHAPHPTPPQWSPRALEARSQPVLERRPKPAPTYNRCRIACRQPSRRHLYISMSTTFFCDVQKFNVNADFFTSQIEKSLENRHKFTSHFHGVTVKFKVMPANKRLLAFSVEKASKNRHNLKCPRAIAIFWAPIYEGGGNGLRKRASGHRRGRAAMTDRTHEIPQDQVDLRDLVRVVSACTLGLWAFAAGLLIGVFLFS